MTANPDGKLARLHAGNALLVLLLDAHGAAWPKLASVADSISDVSLSTDEIVALFRRLFGAHTDVYPVRWEYKAGK